MIFGEMRLILGVALMAIAPSTFGQSDARIAGKWYLTWGYNRSIYTRSDVHIQGEGPSGPFDLTFAAAKAGDMPERFQPKVYFHPGLFTIPQFDVRVGRRLTNGWTLGIGWDHMKYKLSDQTLSATGHAAAGDLAEAGYGPAVGLDDQVDIVLTEAGLPWVEGFNFEHSDGVNFVRVSMEREHTLFSRGPRSSAIKAFGMGSAGLVVCSTDFTWAGERTKNAQHVSGFGASLLGGLRFHANRNLFVQATAQAGLLALPWIRIQGPGDASADQNFGYAEFAFALGYRWG
jgi:hypothetical protein